MKKVLLLLLVAVSAFYSCDELKQEGPEKEPVVVLPDGAVLLEDAGFGMYYGDKNYDGVGVYSIVLSDARCYKDGLDEPYMDSEGDMLVLNLRSSVLPEDSEIELPSGDYQVKADVKDFLTIDPSKSYVKRFVKNSQSVWNIESGTVSFTKGDDGEYTITTSDLAISKGEQKDTVSYVCYSSLELDDFHVVAPSLIGTDDDIIDMPFTDIECVYYGDIYDSGTGNFLINFATKGILEDATGNHPGVYITLNFFSRLYSGNSSAVLEEGTYKVSSMSGSELFTRWSIMPGLLMETTPFGSYVLQQVPGKELVMEFISSGEVKVSYETVGEDKYTIINYELKTSDREIKGMWRGVLPVEDMAEDTGDSYLTTLDHDVECDMSKISYGTMRLIETLHRNNIDETLDYDIAEAWQLYLQPRDWTEDEYSIPWNQDLDGNGLRDRLEAWCGDGDVMVLEFVLPLGSQGVIAPELNKTYTYTLQPNLHIKDKNYEIFTSKMGRPVDEIFDERYAKEFPAWAETLGITSYDRCNARRGFTWADDGFRGNWYLHYETGRHMILDGHAPAINGTVKVTRTGDDIYDIEWDFIDDNPGTANKITGSVKNCPVNVYLN